MENEVIQKEKKSKTPFYISGIAILFLAFLVFGSGEKSITGGSIMELDETIKIPLDSITKKAQFHDYEGIEYFTIKDGNSGYKIAFNACDVCYKAKKGYSQVGEDMVCNNCGNHYAISGLGTQNLKGGGCWPGYLPSSIEGDYMVIQKSDLEKGRYRF